MVVAGVGMNTGYYQIPIEPEAKQLKEFGYARGSYQSKCIGCEQIKDFMDKRATSCIDCATSRYKRLMSACAVDTM